METVAVKDGSTFSTTALQCFQDYRRQTAWEVPSRPEMDPLEYNTDIEGPIPDGRMFDFIRYLNETRPELSAATISQMNGLIRLRILEG